MGNVESFASTQKEQSLSLLGNTKVGGVKNLPRRSQLISGTRELSDKLVEKLLLPSDCKTLHVLEDKILGTEFRHQSHKLLNKRVSGIVQSPLSDE